MKRCVAVVVFALASLAQPAWAQSASGPLSSSRQTGSMIYSQPKDFSDPEVKHRFSKAVAGCTFRRADDAVRKILQFSDPINVDFQAAGVPWHRVKRVMEECMGSQSGELNINADMSQVGMSFSMSRLRALLLEEVYLADNASAPVLAEGSSEATNRRFVSTGDDLSQAQGLASFADCLVYRDAGRVDALLRTELGSDEELRAGKSLAPTLAGCLAQGQTIEFTASSIRALAADGLWARTALGPIVAE